MRATKTVKYVSLSALFAVCWGWTNQSGGEIFRSRTRISTERCRCFTIANPYRPRVLRNRPAVQHRHCEILSIYRYNLEMLKTLNIRKRHTWAKLFIAIAKNRFIICKNFEISSKRHSGTEALEQRTSKTSYLMKNFPIPSFFSWQLVVVTVSSIAVRWRRKQWLWRYSRPVRSRVGWTNRYEGQNESWQQNHGTICRRFMPCRWSNRTKTFCRTSAPSSVARNFGWSPNFKKSGPSMIISRWEIAKFYFTFERSQAIHKIMQTFSL